MTRRPLPSRIGVRVALALALATTAVPTMALTTTATAGAAPPSISTNPLVVNGTAADPIKHVIVVIQSGHSFDNYFGTRPGVDGLGDPSKIQIPLIAGNTTSASPYHLSPDQARAGLTDTLRQTQKAVDGGKMDGFSRAQANISIGEVALGYYDSTDIPYYSSLADRFTLFDHFFAGSQGGSLPNRLVAVSGTSDDVTSNRVLGVGISVPTGTIFDQLNQHNLSWKYYIQGVQPCHARPPPPHARSPVLGMPSIVDSRRTWPGSPAPASTSSTWTRDSSGRLLHHRGVRLRAAPQDPARVRPSCGHSSTPSCRATNGTVRLCS